MIVLISFQCKKVLYLKKAIFYFQNGDQHAIDSAENFIDENSVDKTDKKDDTDTIESPRSCVTPPPLQPPRSWDLIQAGMIDEKEVYFFLILIY